MTRPRAAHLNHPSTSEILLLTTAESCLKIIPAAGNGLCKPPLRRILTFGCGDALVPAPLLWSMIGS
jgi:hypothetical protein